MPAVFFKNEETYESSFRLSIEGSQTFDRACRIPIVPVAVDS